MSCKDDVKAFERQTWKPPAVRLREGKTKGCSNLIAVSISEVKKMLAVKRSSFWLESTMRVTPWELLPCSKKGQALTCTVAWEGASSPHTSWQVLGQKSLQLLGKQYFCQDKVFQSGVR